MKMSQKEKKIDSNKACFGKSHPLSSSDLISLIISYTDILCSYSAQISLICTLNAAKGAQFCVSVWCLPLEIRDRT
ncbi:hypothetical protein EYC80_006079 [Monilinia laxa]|uniref:Uncharacterized protein n=1 Tax=Monilinia laxa TaxID=61186 RepID=A0A5N6KGD4_MONLA|nr:hypothetical protein EYC80_006079 [Monilinia laxa]